MARVREAVSIALTREEVDWIDRLAQRVGVSRSQMVSNILAIAKMDIDLLEKAGVIELMLFGRDMRNRVRKMLQAGHRMSIQEGVGGV
jgi:hypothetical protein